MPKDRNAVDRRQFLTRVSGSAVVAGAGLALAREGAAAPAAKLERRNEQPGMIYTRFGKTNLNVSRLAYGCIKLLDDRIPALAMSVERGVNIVHVSPTYMRGQSILSLGKYLKKPGNRDKVWVMFKSVPDSVDKMDAYLKTLNTDHVDIICAPIHKDADAAKKEPVLANFERLKKAGKVRFLNFTTHGTIDKCLTGALDAGIYSTILPAISPPTVSDLKPVFDRARKMNVGIMAMKSTRRSDEMGPEKIARAMFVGGVTTILKTMITADEVESWIGGVVEAAKQTALAPAETHVASAGDCGLCGVCEEGCPNGVATQDIVRDYTYYYEQLGSCDVAAERYGELRLNQTALACEDCGRCDERCPMNVPVRQIVRAAHERLGTIA